MNNSTFGSMVDASAKDSIRKISLPATILGTLGALHGSCGHKAHLEIIEFAVDEIDEGRR